MSVTSYKTYFRDLAIRNKRLRHDPVSEEPEAPAGKCRFTFFSQNDVITNKLRTAIGDGACLHLHLYDVSLSDNKAFATRGNYDAGFIVSQKVAINNHAQMEAAYQNTEDIAEELIAALYVDYYYNKCEFPLGIPDFDKLQRTPVGPIWDNRFGWFVTFPYSEKRDGSPGANKAIVDEAFFSDAGIFEEQFEQVFE